MCIRDRCVCVCVCVCHETNMQAVQKCFDANELSYKKDKDGTELWGMPKRRIQSGKRITTEVSFTAFKNIKDQKEVLAFQDSFKNVWNDTLADMAIEDLSKQVQQKSIWHVCECCVMLVLLLVCMFILSGCQRLWWRTCSPWTLTQKSNIRMQSLNYV